MQILSNPIFALNVRELPKFPLRKSGSRNTMVTSCFRPEVAIWPFLHAQWSGHNYRNSSFIVDLAMGQIGLPRFTERISSY